MSRSRAGSLNLVQRYEGTLPEPTYITNGVSILQTINSIELYKLEVHMFGLAVGIRLFHAGQHDIPHSPEFSGDAPSLSQYD